MQHAGLFALPSAVLEGDMFAAAFQPTEEPGALHRHAGRPEGHQPACEVPGILVQGAARPYSRRTCDVTPHPPLQAFLREHSFRLSYNSISH
jgi:hypothetical protein